MSLTMPKLPRTLSFGAAAVFLMSGLGWAGLHAWYPGHLVDVTGRTDVASLSCLYCHGSTEAPARGRAAIGARYVSPAGMAVSPDGNTLWVAAEGADRLIEVDIVRGEPARSIELLGRPHGVAISADGRRIAVSSRDRDLVWLLDTATLQIQATVPTGGQPLGLALSGDGNRIYVANGAGDDVLVADLESSSQVRLVAGNEPYAVALSSDGELLAVANRLAPPGPARAVPASEVTLIDARQGRILERRSLISAHLSEGVALSSDGSFALATIIHVRNLLPITQVARGAVMNSAIAFIDTAPGGRTVQFPLDEVNAYFADPSGIALTPDDSIAFVAHGGADTVTAVDVSVLREMAASGDRARLEEIADDLGASSAYVLARIPTAENPRQLVLSPDGRRLYVAEHLADSIGVIDTEQLRMIGRIQLGAPQKQTPERRGERIFSSASVTFQSQFSCRSCHPDGHTDGLVWDFDIDGIGRNLLETRSLRGIRDTAPFKWNGKNPDLETQCGPRFARVLTRSDPFPPEELADLVAFIASIPLTAERFPAELADARERGRRVFFRTQTDSGRVIPRAQRCDTCHRPPLFTDRLLTDVGTGGKFDTPHLLDIGSSAPYLHDGRALTLEEIWTVHSPDDSHGATGDLTKAQLNDLVIFLRGL